MATSVASALHWWARRKPDQQAVVVGDDAVTYRQLQDWSGRLARRLVGEGVSPGNRIGLMSTNSVEWVVTAWGIIKAGGVLVPLNPRLVASELHKILGDSGAGVVVTAEAHEETLKEVVGLGHDLTTVPFDEVGRLRTGGTDDFRIDLDPADPVAILFTSGSTGLSKGVVCTNRTLLDIVFENSLTDPGMRPGARTLLLLPLAFTPGLVYGVVITGVLGGTLVAEREMKPSRAVQLIEKHRITVMFGVPLIFQALAATPEFADADLSSLDTAIVGGAAVPVPLLEAYAAKDVVLRQIYGMTEVGGVATATWPEEAADHPDKCGSGNVFTEIKVVRHDGTECDPGENGEIVMRGPGVTPGYWQDEENTATALRDGWLHSGDLGNRDEGGRLTFVDRLKDLIITGGINVSPFELEAVISQIPGVKEVSVIAAEDERFGETPAAIVWGEGLDEASIIAECNRHMADYKVPRYVVVREDPLPRLPSGKIAKPAIRTEYSDITSTHQKVR
ncbi:class I adenylate-forming enzyme family protein [Pseudonocardia sp. HH130629-09]|uniref:class I adenylate-forming enzyme family protein n=1 Tax=Pseudonocardia sp. HH130629-09 TaxID=1641402 RepID=UPI0006CB161F|nr:AMP-binding protein [Pseudonocardia sp. HH130629-09]ALE84864.1 fatty-acid--CoA ligase [Pseudonocardia sp. HH130629-09]